MVGRGGGDVVVLVVILVVILVVVLGSTDGGGSFVLHVEGEPLVQSPGLISVDGDDVPVVGRDRVGGDHLVGVKLHGGHVASGKIKRI